MCSKNTYRKHHNQTNKEVTHFKKNKYCVFFQKPKPISHCTTWHLSCIVYTGTSRDLTHVHPDSDTSSGSLNNLQIILSLCPKLMKQSTGGAVNSKTLETYSDKKIKKHKGRVLKRNSQFQHQTHGYFAVALVPRGT